MAADTNSELNSHDEGIFLDHLNWDLSVLNRSVAYGNLSSASSHVGLSQPQLSRIVAKLEDQFNVVLLDRDAKRKSSWTPAAHKLSELYGQTQRRFFSDIYQYIEGSQPTFIRIGCLEGLAKVGMEFAKGVIDNLPIQIVELHTFDLSILEEKFLKGSLDFVLTSREPGLKKFKHRKMLGFQTLIPTKGQENSEDYDVLSSFHFSKNHQSNQPPVKKTIVSNSLYIRQQWIEQYGGETVLPSKIRSQSENTSAEVSVILLGLDHFTPSFWKNIEGYAPGLK
ncbi:LysR family transcriptional regulator [Oligoflexaceae bacterium]|nr:LysR family transcriptional regulator [Oligoflexaceae bacterium]